LNSTLQLTFKNRVTRSSHRERIHQGLGPFGVRRLLGLPVDDVGATPLIALSLLP